MKSIDQRHAEYIFLLNKAKKEIDLIKKKLIRKRKLYERLLTQISMPHLVLSNIMFVSAVFLEIAFSYELYLDLVSREVSEINMAFAMTVFFIVLVVCGAAFAAHFLRLFLCKDLRQAQESIYISKGYSVDEASMAVKQGTIRNFWIGLLLSLFILSGVYAFSLERVSLLAEINGEMEISMISVLLPVGMVFLEIVFGTHVLIGIRLFSTRLTIKSLKRKLSRTEFKEYNLKRLIKSCEELMNGNSGNSRSGDFFDSSLEPA